jgi:hypothetical protein
MQHLETIQEFAAIIRGEHPAWKGDRVRNGGFFLRQLHNDFPEEAKALAFDIECNLSSYIEETGLPERRLEQAQKVLFGFWCEL